MISHNSTKSSFQCHPYTTLFAYLVHVHLHFSFHSTGVSLQLLALQFAHSRGQLLNHLSQLLHLILQGLHVLYMKQKERQHEFICDRTVNSNTINRQRIPVFSYRRVRLSVAWRRWRGGQQALDDFELFVFGGCHKTVFQGDLDWFPIFTRKPIICLHWWLWTNRVGVKVFLKQVRLKQRNDNATLRQWNN